MAGKNAVEIYRDANRSQKWFTRWMIRYHPGQAKWYKDL